MDTGNQIAGLGDFLQSCRKLVVLLCGLLRVSSISTVTVHERVCDLMVPVEEKKTCDRLQDEGLTDGSEKTKLDVCLFVFFSSSLRAKILNVYSHHEKVIDGPPLAILQRALTIACSDRVPLLFLRA